MMNGKGNLPAFFLGIGVGLTLSCIRMAGMVTCNCSIAATTATHSAIVGVDVPNSVGNDAKQSQHPDDAQMLFPESIHDVVAGMSMVKRSDFLQQFDMGLSLDKDAPTNENVLILHQNRESLPKISHQSVNHTPSSMQDAFENCDTVSIVLTEPKAVYRRRKRSPKQCLAVVGQWASRHVQTWHKQKKRRGDDGYKLAPHKESVPSPIQFWHDNHESIRDYTSIWQDAREQLRPLLESISPDNNNKKKKDIIVMVLNAGHATLLANFVCSARARGLLEPLDQLVVFPTDQVAHQAAQDMGLNVFYDERLFASIPSGAAMDYHDVNYGRIMMSKVYCVHLVNSLGYNLLFQDVDLVWFKNPLPYFAEKKKDGFDMYFQHDGEHRPERFAPLAANTGFYYVRYTERTAYFFDVFVRMGEMVLAEKSHQAALTTLVSEHRSLYGLKTKVLQEDSALFLSGYHFHAQGHLLRKTRLGRHKPYLYHVNWMRGDEKIPELKKSENWFVSNTCPLYKKERATNFSTECCSAKFLKQ